MIDGFVRDLDRALTGPARLKSDLLTEARDSLTDAAEGYRAGGIDPAEAERRAVSEFGSVAQLANGYQAELAATTIRTLALRIIAVTALLRSSADLMWRGAPWTGPVPSDGYRLLSGSLGWAWIACGLAALCSFVWFTCAARRGRPASVRLARAVSLGLAGFLGLAVCGGIAIYAWSLGLWDAALTWPPMVAGLVALTAAYAWLAHGVRGCLSATGRTTRQGLRPGLPAADPFPGTARPSS
jgi:hypothetical protein